MNTNKSQNSSQIIQHVNDNSIKLSQYNEGYNKGYDSYKDIYVDVQQILADDSLYKEELDVELKQLLDNYIEKILILYKTKDVDFV